MDLKGIRSTSVVTSPTPDALAQRARAEDGVAGNQAPRDYTWSYRVGLMRNAKMPEQVSWVQLADFSGLHFPGVIDRALLGAARRSPLSQ